MQSVQQTYGSVVVSAPVGTEELLSIKIKLRRMQRESESA